jgi:hypothetical protein
MSEHAARLRSAIRSRPFWVTISILSILVLRWTLLWDAAFEQPSIRQLARAKEALSQAHIEIPRQLVSLEGATSQGDQTSKVRGDRMFRLSVPFLWQACTKHSPGHRGSLFPSGGPLVFRHFTLERL